MRGDTLVFTRPLGIKRNAVVLPKGYELISCNFPSQVLQQDDGRVAISFWNSTPSEAALTLRAKPVRNLPAGKSSMASRLGERAYQDVTPQSEIVVFRFAAVKTGESIRLRMFETYTDAERYKLVGDELVWDRSFGRPANAVVLPAGWVLTNSSIPATVSTMSDGRVRLDFVNPRPDEIGVLITARRR